MKKTIAALLIAALIPALSYAKPNKERYIAHVETSATTPMSLVYTNSTKRSVICKTVYLKQVNLVTSTNTVTVVTDTGDEFSTDTFIITGAFKKYAKDIILPAGWAIRLNGDSTASNTNTAYLIIKH